MRENRIARLVLTKQSPIHTTMFWCLSGSHKSKWFKTLSQVLRRPVVRYQPTCVHIHLGESQITGVIHSE